MTLLKPCLALLAIGASLACAVPQACLAESSVTSVLSDSISRSVGSISDSLTGSSHASSPDNRQVKGDYRVIDVAQLADRPGFVELHLRKVVADTTDANEIWLRVPQAAADQGRVVGGAIVAALQRPYGIEFAARQPRAAFFLALADDVARDMTMAPVSL